MKKRIIFITEALWIGGIETALINLLNKIDYVRYDVTVLVCRAELTLKDRINDNCKLIVLDRDKLVSAKKNYRYKYLYHLTEESSNPSSLHKAMMCTVPIIRYIENELFIKYIKDYFKNEKYETAIIYSDRVAEIGVRAINANKYLMFYHNAILEKRYHDEIAYKKCEEIIAVSESKAKDLKNFRSQYSEKIIAIHNLVDIDSIIKKSEERMDEIFNSSDINLVTCGRLAHQKAIDWAIIACKQLIEKGYVNIHWWIVGGGPDEEKLRLQVKKAGLENNFHLLGMKSNPYPYIANADLYIQPSRYENYSVVILEAMVLCKPILATIPAADQQIVSNKNGYLCEANPISIAKGIELLIQNPEECKKYTEYLKENGLEKENQDILASLYKLF